VSADPDMEKLESNGKSADRALKDADDKGRAEAEKTYCRRFTGLGMPWKY